MQSKKNEDKRNRVLRGETLAGILDVFKVSPMTLLRWRRRGLPFTVRNRRHYFSAGEVAAWLREHPRFNHGKGHPKPKESAADLRELQEIENVMAYIEKTDSSMDVQDFFDPADHDAPEKPTPRRRLTRQTV